MSIEIIQNKIASYQAKTSLEEEHALKEITQEIILTILASHQFFREAAFCGGTALRILYGLPRFSEDLDFILTHEDPHFYWKPFLEKVREDMQAYGYKVSVTDRNDVESAVRSAFIKDDSVGKLLNLNYRYQTGPQKKIKIKLEVDTNPPSGATYEIKYLDFPLLYTVRALDLPSLFSGKLHALLCRKYSKGRDWYDFLWYTTNSIKFNQSFLTSALNQMGPWQGQDMVASVSWVKDKLKKKINEIDWKQVVNDVRQFLKANEQTSLDLWGKEVFIKRLEKIK